MSLTTKTVNVLAFCAAAGLLYVAAQSEFELEVGDFYLKKHKVFNLERNPNPPLEVPEPSPQLQ